MVVRMKRSEILEKMVNCFKTCEKLNYSIDKSMSRVLELCEEQGMLPPFNEDVYYKTWRNNGDGYEWDEEGEEG